MIKTSVKYSYANCAYANVVRKMHWRALIIACAVNRRITVYCIFIEQMVCFHVCLFHQLLQIIIQISKHVVSKVSFGSAYR